MPETKDFSCAACGAEFKTKRELDEHNWTNHKEGVGEVGEVVYFEKSVSATDASKDWHPSRLRVVRSSRIPR